MALVYLVGATELADKLAASLESRSDIRLVVGELSAVPSQAAAVVFGPDTPSERALGRAAQLTADHPGLPVIVVAQSVTVSLLKMALRAGVRDVFSVKDKASDIADAILAVHDAGEEEEEEGSGYGRVVTVFGTKGGVGKSVISTNLAVTLANDGYSTILVDLDLQFGDTGIMLQLPPERTIRDVVRSFDKLDTDMLKAFLVEHDSGLRVLLAPVAPEDAEWVEAAHVERILELLRGMADFVVVDSPPRLDDVVLTALDHSDAILAVATLDVPSIKNIRIGVQKLEQLGLSDGRIRLVLNRADSKVGLEAAEVRKATGCEVVAKVPSDRLVPRSVNRGIPVVLDEPKSPVAKSLIDLAEKVVKARDAAARKPVGGVSSDVA